MRRGEAVDELDLVGRGHDRLLVLQPVARADLDDRHAPRRHENSTSVASAWTRITLAAADGRNDPVAERAQRQLHLHRLEDDDDVPLLSRRRQPSPGL